jgi:clan AA aspartic protease
MGMVRAEITLTNSSDESFASQGHIKEEDVRAATVTAVVDTGAMSLVITEDLREKLGLRVIGEKTVKTASGQRLKSQITDGVGIKWKDRLHILSALVVPGVEEILLGAIPLEGLDLMVNPVTQELVGVHGDHEEYIVYSC